MKVSENKEQPNIILRVLFWMNIAVSLLMGGAYLSTHISPNTFSYFAFLGLSFPIWLLLTVAFLIFWFFFRRKWMLISALTLIIGFNHVRHFISFTLIQPKLLDPVKVMSYNVRIFNLYDLENRVQTRDQIFEFLKAENPGIICFQEYFHQDGGTEFVTRDAMTDLLDLPFYHERYTHKMLDEKYFGVATFSRYPIVNKGEIPFENDKNNFCIYSDIVIGEDTLRVFNAHIGSIRFQQEDYQVFDETAPEDSYMDAEDEERIIRRLKTAFEKRAIQAEVIAAEIDRSPYPVVLCGDLNDTPVSYCYRQFSSRLEDAFVESGNGIGASYIGIMPSNRIDYIFHSEEILSAHFTTHSIEQSDHRPVSCVIDIP